jgi:uncharacterized delta-60 repeat protein
MSSKISKTDSALWWSTTRVVGYLTMVFALMFVFSQQATAQLPGKPTLTAPPVGTIDQTPTISWAGGSYTDTYEVWVNNQTTGQSEVVHVSDIVNTFYTPSTNLPYGDYRVWVRGSSSLGDGPWSDHRDFRILDPANDPPPVAVLTGPPASTLDATPTITWLSAVTATYYDIWISNLTTGESPYLRVPDFTATNPTEESYTPSSALVAGSYRVWVQARNANGVGDWSAHRDFTIVDPNQPPSGKPNLTAPPAATSDRTPTIAWEAVAGATKYEVWVNNLTTGQDEVIHVYNITTLSYTPGSNLDYGDYAAWVRAGNAYGDGPWSDARNFEINDGSTAPPGKPTLISPPSSTTDTTPTIIWNPVSGASYYDLWVNNLTTGEQQVIRERNLTTTSFTPSSALADGTYVAWVQARNSSGESSWSDGREFTVTNPNQPPGKTVLTGPPAEIADRTPTVSWNAVTGATDYEVWVNNQTTGQSEVIHVYNISNTSYTPSSVLAYGDYRAWVRASNAFGDGPWSDARDFEVTDGSSAPPSTPAMTAPDGTITDTTPTFAWTASSGATFYDLWVNNLTTGQQQVIREENLTTNSYTPTTALTAGDYRAWVQARNGSGESEWSAEKNFTIQAAQPPARPTMSWTGTELAWNSVSGADRYDLWINNVTTGQSEVVREENLTVTSYRPFLADGSYRAWVRAINQNGAGEWSAEVNFDLSAGSSAGELDVSFGTDGRVSIAASSSGFRVIKILELPNGGILIGGVDNPESNSDEVGLLTLVLLTPGGAPDQNFGSSGNGIVRLNPSGDYINDDWFRDMVLQPDGKILVLAAMHDSLFRMFHTVFRINQDGSFDTSFGYNGKATLSSGTYWEKMALQSDGKIVISGEKIQYPNYYYTVQRLNDNGSVDTSFGNSGEVAYLHQTHHPSRTLLIAAETINGAERILIAQEAVDNVSNDREIWLARLQLDGSLDYTFNSGGTKAVSFTSHWFLMSRPLVVAQDKLVFAGKYNATSSDNFILRLDSNGSLDQSFGSQGIVSFDPPNNFGSHTDIAAQPLNGEEKLLSVQWDEDTGTRLFRLTPDGTIDNSFSGDGEQSVPEIASVGGTAGPRLAVTENGTKLIVAGSDGDNLLIFRYSL